MSRPELRDRRECPGCGRWIPDGWRHVRGEWVGCAEVALVVEGLDAEGLPRLRAVVRRPAGEIRR